MFVWHNYKQINLVAFNEPGQTFDNRPVFYVVILRFQIVEHLFICAVIFVLPIAPRWWGHMHYIKTSI